MREIAQPCAWRGDVGQTGGSGRQARQVPGHFCGELLLPDRECRRAARIALTQYEQGQTDFTTVVTAERSLLSYEDQLVQAEAAIPSSLTAVYRALGGGWEIREGRPLVSEANRRQMVLRTDWGPLLDYDDGRLTPPSVRGIFPEPTF